MLFLLGGIFTRRLCLFDVLSISIFVLFRFLVVHSAFLSTDSPCLKKVICAKCDRDFGLFHQKNILVNCNEFLTITLKYGF